MDASLSSKGRNLVFILDDDLAVREALKFALQLEGLKVETCAGAAELLSHPKLAEAACLVVDPNLPTMDEGFEMLDRLATSTVKPFVIVITSRATPRLRERSKEFGVSRILEKPLLDRALADAIQNTMGRRPAEPVRRIP